MADDSKSLFYSFTHFAPPEIKAASGLKIILSVLIINPEDMITEKVKAAKRKSCAG